MEIQQNSDFFFFTESFKLFFEKVFAAVNDPSGIAVKEWLKFKDQLSQAGATPSSIYSYANQLVINDAKHQSDSMVKVKKQAPKKDQAGQENYQTGQVQGTENRSYNNQNVEGITQKVNQYSPWVESEKKVKGVQETHRINMADIQSMKGLSEISNVVKDTKLAEKLNTSKNFLLDKLKKCIEQYQKDTKGLDLIHDRSFQTQTMLVENKPTIQRSIKRQDSRFIKELSIYSKKGAPQGLATVKDHPQSHFENQHTQETKNDNQSKTEQQGKQEVNPQPQITTPMQFNFEFDYVKSKNPTQNVPTTNLPPTQPVTNYLLPTTAQQTISPPPSVAVPSYLPTSTAPTQTIPPTSNTSTDIDSLVQRILRDQKAKEQQTFSSPGSDALKGVTGTPNDLVSPGAVISNPQLAFSPPGNTYTNPYAFTQSPYTFTPPVSGIPSYTSSPYTLPTGMSPTVTNPTATNLTTSQVISNTANYLAQNYNFGQTQQSPNLPPPK